MNNLPDNFKRILRNLTFWANVQKGGKLPMVNLPNYECVEYKNDGKTMIVRPTN